MNMIYREAQDCRFHAHCGALIIKANGMDVGGTALKFFTFDCGAFDVCLSTDRSLSNAHSQNRSILK